MVVLTIGAQVLDTLLIKTATFTVEQLFNILRWGGGSLYSYYYPTISDLDKLKIENTQLKEELENLHKRLETEIIVVDDND